MLRIVLCVCVVVYFFPFNHASAQTGDHIRFKIFFDAFYKNADCHEVMSRPLRRSLRMEELCIWAAELINQLNRYNSFNSALFEKALINFLFHSGEGKNKEMKRRFIEDPDSVKVTLNLTPKNRLFIDGKVNSLYMDDLDFLQKRPLSPDILKKESGFEKDRAMYKRLNERIIYNREYIRKFPRDAIVDDLKQANDMLQMTIFCDFHFCDQKTREEFREKLLLETIKLQERHIIKELPLHQQFAYELQKDAFNHWMGKKAEFIFKPLYTDGLAPRSTQPTPRRSGK